MSGMQATREAYGQVLLELGQEMEDLVVLDADLSGSTKTAAFGREFPARFFNFGVAEQGMMGAAAGLAAAGKTPFVSTFAIFAAGRAWEVLRQSVCYPGLNVKVAASHSGLTVGEDGASHQALEDLALTRVLPNLTVLVPADGVQTRSLVLAAARTEGPFYIRLGRPKVPFLFEEDTIFEIGKAVSLREGEDVLLVATGPLLGEALAAAEALKEEGIGASVLNIHTLKPLDRQAVIEAARRTGAVVTVEEHSVIGGLGSAVSEVLSEEHPVPVIRVGVNDVFGRSGAPDQLLEHYGLKAPYIVKAAFRAIEAKSRQ